MGGSKGGTSTSTVQVPAQVLANYQAVNANAQQVAKTPFQTYGGQFVAPVNSTQQAGINNVNNYSQSAQPYFADATGAAGNAANIGSAYNTAATGLALQGAQAVNATPLNSSAINEYLSPYLSDVADTTEALNNQQYQQAQSGQLGTAISSGAFGGDRAGIAAANLQQQQSLANNAEVAGLLNTGYNTALSTAQQQQQLGLGAAQANRGAIQQAEQQVQSLGQQGYTQGLGLSSQLASLGTGAQGAALSGAQAQLAAGQVQQGTQQAQDTAEYNQFLQQQSYPFQVAQFLANIAEGTGSLSGSTTTTNSVSNGIFSDERLKEDVRAIGKTYDGQTIYSYRYKGDPHTQIGLLAQEVEKKHPDAVGLAAGFKTVDYDKATDKASARGHFALGGFAGYDPAVAMADYQAMYGPLLNAHGGLGAGSIVPSSSGPTAQLHPAQANIEKQPNAMQSANSTAQTANLIGSLGDRAGVWNYGHHAATGVAPPASASIGNNGSVSAPISADDPSIGASYANDSSLADDGLGGGFADGGRIGLTTGGDALPYDNGTGVDIPDDVQNHQMLQAAAPPVPADHTGQDIMDAVKLAFPFLNRGGRAKLASGGDPVAAAFKAAISPWGKYGSASDEIAAQEAAGSGLAPPTAPVSDPELAAQDAPVQTNTSAPSKPLDGVAPSNVASVSASAPGLAGPPAAIAKLIQKAEGTSKNPNSSAMGSFQILNSTLKANASAVDPVLAKMIAGMSNSDLTAYRLAHPELEDTYKAIGQKLTLDNYHALDQAGITPTAGNVYLAHFLGSAGAKSLLSADPDTPVGKLVSSAAIKANPSVLAGKTAADVVNWANKRMVKMASARKSGGRTGFNPGGVVPQDLLVNANGDPIPFENGPSSVTSEPVTPMTDINGAPVPPAGVSPAPGATPTPNAALFGAPAGNATSFAQDSTANAKPMLASTDKPASHDNFIKGIGRGEATSIIPLLAGIGALATTQTNNPLTALAASLGAGAQAAQGQREFGLEQQHVSNETVGAQANAAVSRANALSVLQQARREAIGNTQAMTDFYVRAKSYHDSGIITDDDLKSIEAPAATQTLGSVTPDMGAYAPPPSALASPGPTGLAPPATGALAPSSAAPGTASALSLAQAFPNLAKSKPAADTVIAPLTKSPYSTHMNPGDAIKDAAFQNNSEFAAYQTFNSQADALAEKIRQQPPTSPLLGGMQAQLQALREQAQAHYGRAQAQVDAATTQPVQDIQRGATELADFASKRYQQIINATSSAANAASQTELNVNSGPISKMFGDLAGIGIPISDAHAALQGNAEISERNRALMNMFSISDSGSSARAQGTELNSLNKYGTSDPGPASGYDAAIKTRALAEQEKELADAFVAAAPSMTNAAKFKEDFINSHPIERYIDEVVQNTPWAKGMTAQQKAAYLKPVSNKAALLERINAGDKYVNIGGVPHQVIRTSKGPQILPLGRQ